MKRITSIILALLLALTVASCAGTDKSDADRLTSDDISDSSLSTISDFCMDFQRELAKTSDGSENTLIAPLSAYIALSMLKEGADAATLDEITAVLGETEGEEMLALITHLVTLKDTTLRIADSVWLDNTFEPIQDYIGALAKYYYGETFWTELKDAEGYVNRWIDENTDGMIKNLLGETALDTSVMVLINAMYMDAEWENAFDTEATDKRDFTSADGSISHVDFMHKTASVDVVESTDYIGVTLPYSDGSLVFLALMPKDDGTDMLQLIDSVAADGGWGEISTSGISENVSLYLPKFEHESSFSLTEILKEMGITAAFDTKAADFSKIAEGLYLDGVTQSVALKLHEAGTEAAAATVVTVPTKAASPSEDEPRTIEFNRPFAFAVVDSVSGAVLFAGEHNSAE